MASVLTTVAAMKSILTMHVLLYNNIMCILLDYPVIRSVQLALYSRRSSVAILCITIYRRSILRSSHSRSTFILALAVDRYYLHNKPPWNALF